MGCDIHCVIERKRQQDRDWLGVISSDFCQRRPQYAQRDYGFFAQVASVRGSTSIGCYPQNIPEDVSQLAWQLYMECPTDHHSASHMDLSKFAEIWLSCNPNSEVRKEHILYDLFGVFSDERGDEYRIVFWFDN